MRTVYGVYRMGALQCLATFVSRNVYRAVRPVVPRGGITVKAFQRRSVLSIADKETSLVQNEEQLLYLIFLRCHKVRTDK